MLRAQTPERSVGQIPEGRVTAAEVEAAVTIAYLCTKGPPKRRRYTGHYMPFALASWPRRVEKNTPSDVFIDRTAALILKT